MSKVKVSKDAWLVLERAANQLMVGTVRQEWLDQCSTSAASKAAGGIVKFDTDYDWLLLFFAWLNGQPIPREPRT